jgi:uncharacterized linocin/CFP29 family protein
MNLLRKNFAPISKAAWDEINKLAKETLSANLSARKFADVEGPYGVDYPAVNLGRLEIPAKQKPTDVRYGIHSVLPLIETRVNFALDIWELDNIERGAKDLNFDPLTEASRKLAAFEENVIFNGFKEGKIEGLNQIVAKNRIPLTLDKDSIVDAISEGQTRMKKEGITEKANLVVNPALWKYLARLFPGGTLLDLIKAKIGGSVIYSEAVDGALLVADREGDLEITIGQDFAVGYHHHDAEKVHLFLTESFTFRVITPEAIVGFQVK